MEKAVIWAVVAELEEKGKWNIVGLYMGGQHWPVVNSKRQMVEAAFEHVSQEAKDKGARIVKFVETEE